MTHLTPAGLLERAGRPDAPDPHLAECRACRDEVTRLRQLLADVRACDVPEPSPLFWQHFPGRMTALLESEELPAPRWWRSLGWRLLAPAVAAVAVLVTAVTMTVRGPSAPGGRESRRDPAARPTVESERGAAAGPAVEGPDEAWALLEQLADGDGVVGEQGEVGDVVAGTSDLVVAELTSAQQAELVHLLESELSRSVRPVDLGR